MTHVFYTFLWHKVEFYGVKMLHLMRQTVPCCFGALVAVTTLHIRNRAFHTEQIKAGLATDHSWTHFSTYAFCESTCTIYSQPHMCALSLSSKERGLAGILLQDKSHLLHLGLFHRMAWAAIDTVLKPGHQLAPNSAQRCSSTRSSDIAPVGLKFPFQIRQHTHVRLKRHRNLHTSSRFDRFVVIYSTTCRIHQEHPWWMPPQCKG